MFVLSRVNVHTADQLEIYHSIRPSIVDACVYSTIRFFASILLLLL